MAYCINPDCSQRENPDNNANQSWIVGSDSLYSADLLKQGTGRMVLAIAWHPMSDLNSAFIQQAQKLWKIPVNKLVENTDITWRTATSYDAVLVLSKTLKVNPTRSGIQKTLTMAEFSVTGATGVMQFQGSDRRDSKITMVTIRRNCNHSGFVFTVSDRPLVCN